MGMMYPFGGAHMHEHVRFKCVWPQRRLVAAQVMKLPKATPVTKVRTRPEVLEVMVFTEAVASSEKPLVCGRSVLMSKRGFKSPRFRQGLFD